jgi:alcohol dehydrogenase (cytochrome c)
MKWWKSGLILAASSLAAVGFSHPLTAQNVDAAMLLHPPADSWPGYQGDYSGRRHSSLTQITPENVSNLTLAWAYQTNQPAEIKATPILVDGVLYFTVPDNVWAIDARSGHMLWHYTYPPGRGHV